MHCQKFLAGQNETKRVLIRVVSNGALTLMNCGEISDRRKTVSVAAKTKRGEFLG